MVEPNPAALIYWGDDSHASLEWSTGVEPNDFAVEHLSVLLTPEGELRASELASERQSGSALSVELDSLLDRLFVDAVRPQKAGYHLATQDHPFLDMSLGVEARIQDAEIMAGYVEVDDYPSVYLELDVLERYPLEQATDLGIDELRNSSFYQLSAIFSGVFGLRRRQPAYFDPFTGYHQVELLFKSIPSGGARHPCECFVEIFRSPSLPSGYYHYNVRRNSLDLIRAFDFGAENDELSDDSAWGMRLLLAPMVRRAMFRYRDPRSFRALLVDAGHANGQLKALSSFCNWRYRSRLSLDMDYTSKEFGLSRYEAPLLSEGVLEGWE